MDAQEGNSNNHSVVVVALEQFNSDKHSSAQVHDEQGNTMAQQKAVELSGAKKMCGKLVGGEGNKSTRLFGKGLVYWGLMILSSAALVFGLSSATLLGRLYFVHGGSRRWLYTWIECTGWPILLIPLAYCYWRQSISPTPLTLKLIIIYLIMGCLTALDNLLYSWGLSYLPVSTNSLLSSSQLAFNAVFAYALVGQKFTSYVLNSIVIITMGAVLLGVSSASDKPQGTTDKQYIIGFIVTVVASALFALLLPLMELIYKKVVGKASFARVMEVQVGISVVASVFSLIGMWADGDFKAVREEAMSFDLGVAAYTSTLVWSAVGWQLYVLGGAGIIFLASSLMSCVFMTAMIPILPILAVAFFHDSFSALKAIAMLLSIWGFISYLYGGYLDNKEAKKISSLPLSSL